MRSSRKLNYADDQSIVAVLEQLGLLAQIKAGAAVCSHCNKQMSVQSVGAIYKVSGALKLVCGDPPCIAAMSAFLRDQSLAETEG